MIDSFVVIYNLFSRYGVGLLKDIFISCTFYKFILYVLCFQGLIWSLVDSELSYIEDSGGHLTWILVSHTIVK